MKNKQKVPTCVSILGVNITSISKEEVLSLVRAHLKKKKQLTIVTPNPEMIVEAQKNEPFRKALHSADVAIADGTGLLFAEVVLYRSRKLKRVPGRLLMEGLFSLAKEEHLKVFLLGASSDVNAQAVKKLAGKVVVKGSHGFQVTKEGEAVSEVDRESQIDVVERINKFQPDILCVAFGAPKQEQWITKHKDELKATIVVGVGGSLDYYVGQAKKPPYMVSYLGFEWFWRLLTQPTRLSRMYSALVVFPWLIVRQKIYGHH